MKRRVVALLLLLTGCYASTSEAETVENVWQVAGENTPNFEEIERIMTNLELEIGLGNLREASALFDELEALMETYEMTPGQEARYHTFSALLLEMRAGEEARIFSGSDAVSLVMNVYGAVPEGYQFVYHEIPSFVGSDGLGYYVFLVSDVEDMSSAVERFFVTDQGQILTLQ